ncbi:MAG TPA: R3H domain-containing nucleic acid-binding protein [Verrucomicrobiae bacterium]|nr:R3H domain-containing nucleic acid-binding protein [Verrucomicrobiae bacterium]
MENHNNEKLKNRIKELLNYMGFEPEVYERMEEGRVVFNIKTRDAQLLIGKQGSTLESLQHIVRILSRQDGVDERYPFALDIDDYKDKRVIYLKELARKAAHQVRDTKRAVSLAPMPAYERRIIHNYLSLYSDIKSESMGKDPNRKIIIRYKQQAKGNGDFNFIENM